MRTPIFRRVESAKVVTRVIAWAIPEAGATSQVRPYPLSGVLMCGSALSPAFTAPCVLYGRCTPEAIFI